MFEGLGGYALLVAAFISAITLSYLGCRFLMAVEKRRALAQPIHRLGVADHHLKSGTPSLGGLSIFGVALLLFLVFGYGFLSEKKVQGLLFGAGGFFAVGFLDDLKKLLKKDERGLSALLRIGAEVIVTLLSLYLLDYEQHFRWEISLYPFDRYLALGASFIALALFAVVGTANANNLMDGLDGLEGGVSLIALAPFVILALFKSERGLALFLLLLCGTIIGFLILNLHPARIFMGDGGSLFIGATLALSAISLNRLSLLPLVGLLYVAEALSVILQVGYFKMTRRRLFLMAPLHHHFELKKIPEYRIVMGYYLFQSAISILIVVMEVLL